MNMRIEKLKSSLIGILCCLVLVLATTPLNSRMEAKAFPSPFLVAESFGTNNTVYDFNVDGKVDMKDIAEAAKQYTGQSGIAETTILDPLEAWSEAELIIWQYNSTHYGCRNMSTLMALAINTNLTLVEQYALGNMTSGLLYMKDVVHNTSLTLEDDEIVIQCVGGVYQSFSNKGKGFLISQLAADPTGLGAADQGFWWYNTAEDVMKYWNGTAIVIFPSIGGGSTTTYTMPYSFICYRSGLTYYAKKYDGTTLCSSTNATTVIQAALGNGTGIVTIRPGIYSISGSGLVLGDDDVLVGEGWDTILEVEADNIAVVTVGVNGSITYRSGIRDLKIRDYPAATYTGTRGIEFHRSFYGTYQNIFIDSLTNGTNILEDPSGHSCDNWFDTIYIINFYNYGFAVTDWEDTMLSNINIGTSKAGATACLYVDNGGSGIFVNNLHWWGVLDNTTYGIFLNGGASRYTYRTLFNNIYGGDTVNGIQVNGSNALGHRFSNVEVVTTTNDINDAGTETQWNNVRIDGDPVTPMFLIKTGISFVSTGDFTAEVAYTSHGYTPLLSDITAELFEDETHDLAYGYITEISAINATYIIVDFRIVSAVASATKSMLVTVRFNP